MPSMQPAFQAEAMPYERRKSRRVRLVTTVETKTVCDVDSLGHCEDISENGLAVATRETIQPKTEVIVRFRLPLSPRRPLVEALGEVVRIRPAKLMGIRFVELKAGERKAIEEFVQRAGQTDAGWPDARRKYCFHAKLSGVGRSPEEAWLNALQTAGPVPEEYTEFQGEVTGEAAEG